MAELQCIMHMAPFSVTPFNLREWAEIGTAENGAESPPERNYSHPPLSSSASASSHGNSLNRSIIDDKLNKLAVRH